MKNNLNRIQNWYEANCNDDWEHTYGIEITNIDNPGWSVEIDLADSYLQEIGFNSLKYQKENENNWVHCAKEKYKFVGYGGPQKLDELLGIFLDWAEKHEPN